MRALTSILVATLAGFAVLTSSCSMDVDKPRGGGLKVILDDSAAQALEASPLSVFWRSATSESPVRVFAAPSTINDFNCFAVNVTGSGISSRSNQLEGCSSPNNMDGTGPGILSDDSPRGKAIELVVPSGPKRRVNVYGIYPGNCVSTGGSGGGSDGGYFLGGVTADLEQDASVVVPIAFNGAGPSVTCTGGSHGSNFGISGVFPYGGVDTGGFTVNINGQGFDNTTTVTIDGNNCPVTSVTANTLQCTAPAGSVGSNLPVTVTKGIDTVTQSHFSYVSVGSPFISVDKNTSDVNFGSRASGGGTSDVTIMFMNTGGTSGTASESIADTTHFNWVGGSYPGTGGDCSVSLSNASTTCTVVVRFAPASTGAKTTTLTIFGLPITLNGVGL